MAKKGNRQVYMLECTKCKVQNYSTTINRNTLKENKTEVKRFCPQCKTHTVHKFIKT